MIYVIKKDGTREKFNVEKIINAVNKSAGRILYEFTEDEKRRICDFAFSKAESLGKENIDIEKAILDCIEKNRKRAEGVGDKL